MSGIGTVTNKINGFGWEEEIPLDRNYRRLVEVTV